MQSEILHWRYWFAGSGDSMRKITEQSVRAFLDGQVFNSGNMNVSVVDGDVHLYLHGNLIARKFTVPGGFGVEDSVRIEIRDAGWQSNTTKERLNGLLDTMGARMHIYQRNFEWFIGSHSWNGRALFTISGDLLELFDE